MRAIRQLLQFVLAVVFPELVLVSEGYQAALAAVVVLAVFSELVSEGYQTALAVCCSGCCCFQNWSWCLRAIRQLLLFVDVAVVVFRVDPGV